MQLRIIIRLYSVGNGMNTLNLGGICALIVMYAVFFAVGIAASKKAANGTMVDLILAGRSVPLWVALMTMTATWVDGGYLLGTAEGAFHSLGSALQGGICFGLSLILGGVFFASIMRKKQFTTLIDAFDVKFGKSWSVVLALPALLGEIFWSAELLVAMGASVGIIIDIPLAPSILISALVVTFYTLVGGMWSVAYTDVVQLVLIPIGLIVAIPYAWDKIGGFSWGVTQYLTSHPMKENWSLLRSTSWWDLSLMLILGGIPWNCYFQRVLSSSTPAKARAQSILAGLLTMLLTIPPLCLGVVAAVKWQHQGINPATALPLLLRDMVPVPIALFGLAAIVGAITSSFSSSILSAGSMITWNVYGRVVNPHANIKSMKLVLRVSILLLGTMAALMALRVPSVQKLWFFSSDLVFVLLLPQLVAAIADQKVNRIASIIAFISSLVLRVGAGEPLFGLEPFLPYPEGFPFRTVAALNGSLLLFVIPRMPRMWHITNPTISYSRLQRAISFARRR